VTHEDDIAARARRVVRLRDGRIERVSENRPATGLPPAPPALPAGGERSGEN